MRKITPLFLLLIAAAPGTNTIQCTGPCVASDGTTQPSGTNLSYIICGQDNCSAWIAGGGLPANTALVAGQVGSLYTSPASAPTNAQAAAALQARGLTITSTGTPALNAVYAMDQTTIALITSEELYIVANGTFSNGTGTLTWLYAQPPVTFPNVTSVKTVASTIAQTITALADYGAGATNTAPSMSVTIP